MARQTYRTRSDFNPSCVDSAILAIANKEGSGKVVTLKNISINMQSTTADAAASSPGHETLVRISAHAGGTNLTVTPMDSNSSLPSQVTVKTDSRITVTANSTMRRSVCVGQFRESRIPPYALIGGNSILNCSQIYANNSFGGGLVQGIVLREGEGIAWYPPAGSRPPSNYFGANIRFRTDEVGNPTYNSYTIYSIVADDNPAISLFNATGSGVVITVLGIEAHEVGSDQAPCFSIILIDGIDSFFSGQSITPIKMDSQNEDVPSSIQIKGNCGIKALGSSLGLDPGGGSMSPDAGASFTGGVSVSSATVGLLGMPYWWWRTGRGPKIRQYIMPPVGLNRTICAGGGRFLHNVFEGDLVLRPGQGIAVMVGYPEFYWLGASSALNGAIVSNSSLLNYMTTAVFTVEDATVPGYAA